MELLAPAGNLEKLQTALTFGADAVYCGIPDFSLRVRINDFNLTDLKKSREITRKQGRKLYVTANILAHNFHLEKLKKFFTELKKIKPDAVIIADPGVLKILQKVWPTAVIHLSTQANCTNKNSAKFWFENGVKRIILGREVSIKEIKEIKKFVPNLELEYFVHGAMCLSYSGRCYLSKYFNDRSANQGDCTQPCRWNYNVFLEEKQRPENFFPIDEDKHGTYLMNSKDLCLIEHLAELKKAGIDSIKIEGRAKSVYYVGNTIKVYREAIDLLKKKITPTEKNKKLKYFVAELKKSQNRGFTSGFAFGRDKVEQRTESSHEECNYEFCGQVLKSENKKNLKIFPADTSSSSVQAFSRRELTKVLVHNQLFVGDKIEIVRPNQENINFAIKEIFDLKGTLLSEVHGGQKTMVYLALPEICAERSLLRRIK
ncbi:MAG: U32 family peptidase C-terminal domain-containing protein [Patescibacteria group bacterium]